MDDAIERLRLDLRRPSRRCRRKREAYPPVYRARVAVLASEWAADGRTLECLATRLVTTTLYRWLVAIKPTEPGLSMIPVRVVVVAITPRKRV